MKVIRDLKVAFLFFSVDRDLFAESICGFFEKRTRPEEGVFVFAICSHTRL